MIHIFEDLHLRLYFIRLQVKLRAKRKYTRKQKGSKSSTKHLLEDAKAKCLENSENEKKSTDQNGTKESIGDAKENCK